eukprot:CAMPEP_0172932060 /NCGR_PEP_ID=MMETSP1075-20121228/219807_1 /TAXON_ID=2916 /ORGANISM="Ceratium fusus, Strain PA161109" /LENGTH=128 /DNA_ID=CAMNT_0013793383 /DNA_START=252 /DNA_END=639 /DNA_ORIENTATION=-
MLTWATRQSHAVGAHGCCAGPEGGTNTGARLEGVANPGGSKPGNACCCCCCCCSSSTTTTSRILMPPLALAAAAAAVAEIACAVVAVMPSDGADVATASVATVLVDLEERVAEVGGLNPTKPRAINQL